MSAEPLVQALDHMADAILKIAPDIHKLAESTSGFSRCPTCRHPRVRIQAAAPGERMRTVCPTCMADALVELGRDPSRPRSE